MDDKDITLADELEISLERDRNEFMSSAVEKINRSGRLLVEAGLELLAAKRGCTHGEWLPLLESYGLTQQKGSEIVRMTKFAASLPAAERRKILSLPKKKVLALAAAEPETVAGLLESGEAFDAMTALSPIEMRRKLKALEGQKATLEARLELKDRELRQERERRVERSQPYPEFVMVARGESNALAEKARLCLDDLGQIHADHMALHALNRGDQRAVEYWEAAAAAIYFNTRAVVAQAVALIRKLEAELPETVTGEVAGAYLYDEASIAQAALDREVLTQLHAHEKALRQQGQEAGRQRKSGRPRKGTK
jgi:hypothetical protein